MKTSDAYIGFAVKKGSVIYGFDALCERPNNVKLILADQTTNPKIVKKLESLRDYIPCKLAMLTQDTIANVLKSRNTKVLSITDSGLAKAIYQRCEDILKLESKK